MLAQGGVRVNGETQSVDIPLERNDLGDYARSVSQARTLVRTRGTAYRVGVGFPLEQRPFASPRYGRAASISFGPRHVRVPS